MAIEIWMLKSCGGIDKLTSKTAYIHGREKKRAYLQIVISKYILVKTTHTPDFAAPFSTTYVAS